MIPKRYVSHLHHRSAHLTASQNSAITYKPGLPHYTVDYYGFFTNAVYTLKLQRLTIIYKKPSKYSSANYKHKSEHKWN